MAAPVIIRITDREGTSDNLILKDVNGNSAHTFIVKPGVTIKWLLANNTPVKKITRIYKKDSSENVFSTDPHPVGGSLNWEGTIDNLAVDKSEEYNIEWEDADTIRHTYDPLIQVKPTIAP
jgi:hypothetical protein